MSRSGSCRCWAAVPKSGLSARCSLFFQLALVAGYAAAYAARRLPLRVALALHVSLLALAWWSWPFTAGGGPPSGAPPTLWTLQQLAGQVGLLLIALTATSPLLQSAYARAWPSLDPYPLFAASNAGSLLGLCAYPLVVEPLLTLPQQARAWSAAAVLLIGLLAVTAAGLAGRHATSPAALPLDPGPAITMRTRLRWLLLALVPSLMLLAVTAQITTDIAPVPLLWILPLAVYLASFIRVFSRGWQPGRWTWPVMALSSVLMLLTFGHDLSRLRWIGVHLAVLWCASLLCHGALVQKRPRPARVPEFYLLMALGGATGGCVAVLIAPLIFTMRIEYPLAVLATLWLSPRRVGFTSQLRVTRPVVAGLVVIGASVIAYVIATHSATDAARTLTLASALAAAMLWHRPRVFTVLMTIALAGVIVEQAVNPHGVRLRGRTFYGTYSVRDVPETQTRVLFHGNTLHGLQSLRAGHQQDPLSYYGPTSPLAELMHSRPGRLDRVALIGLGAGVILRYAEPDSRWTVYEIDPAIAQVAQDPALFTHWTESHGSPLLVVGDGRLRMSEAPDASYDLIIVDAFASDSVPLHLLTREALSLYTRKLRGDGEVLFHVSNRYLDLAPAIGGAAQALGLKAYTASGETMDEAAAIFPSRWVRVPRLSAAALPPSKLVARHPTSG